MPRFPLAPILLPLAMTALVVPTTHSQTTLHTFSGTQAGESHGYSVANAGDVDGDGFDDIIVGSPFHNGLVFPIQLADSGRIFVRSGATGEVLMVKYGEAAQHNFGFDVDGAGDVNGDGFADVIVGVPGKQDGAFKVFFGPDGSTSYEKLSVLFGQSGFGTSVAGCGDANADGFDDVVVGSPYEFTIAGGSEAGSVHVYDVHHDDTIGYVLGKEAFAHLGWSVDGAGDVDGDGRTDVIAGEPHRDIEVPMFPSGSTLHVDVGRAYVFSTGTTAMTPYRIYSGGLADDAEFGYAVAGGGLINGDSVPDLVVSSPGFFGDIGNVKAYSGATSTVLSTYTGSNVGERFGEAVAAGGDFNGDGLLDVIVGAPSHDLLPLSVNRGRIEVLSALSGAILHTATALSGGQIGFSVDIGARTDDDAREEIIYGAPYNDTVSTNAGVASVVSSSDFPAVVAHYGQGLAGTLGEPEMGVIGAPSLGTDMQLVLTSSATVSAPSILATGLAPIEVAFKGGSLLVNPWQLITLGLQPGSTPLPVSIPSDTQLLGFDLFLQLWQGDAGAVLGVSLSDGLQLTFGD